MSRPTALILVLCSAIAAFSQTESDSSPAARPNPARDAALKGLMTCGALKMAQFRSLSEREAVAGKKCGA
jgi:hypothetical protein